MQHITDCNFITLDKSTHRDFNGTRAWPRLEDLGLTPSQRAARIPGIGGSDANIILSGDADSIFELWQVKRGQREPRDLSAELPVMLGCWTEAFNRHWYQKITGELLGNVGQSFVSAERSWQRCTVDGMIVRDGAVWEAKHTNAFIKPADAVRRYMPQLQHNMCVVGTDRAVLSVLFGNHKWEVFDVAADWLYQEELLIAEARFWDCVRTGERPVAAPVPQAPQPIGVREVSLEGNNAWASAAADWLHYREPARRYAAAAAQLKDLVEDDVSRAHGHGVEARRSKNGALTLRECCA